MPTRIIFGENTLDRLVDSPALQSAKKVGLFVGASSLKSGGHLQKIQDMLKGKEVYMVENVPPEPGTEDLIRETQELRKRAIHCVVAAGGGSVMDLAKAAAFCARQPQDTTGILQSPPVQAEPSIPVVAIPTTAGTGSEVTPFTVFWDHTAKKKYSIHHEKQYPAEAIVDPELTYSMPSHVTASTGMDAFTQACEAYWNNNHNAVSDDYALLAIRRILPALPAAVKDGGNKAARHDMMLGSLQGGLAFSNTRTAACHSVSYPMTLHFGVSHGQAVGVTLPEVIKLNATVMPQKTEKFCEALGVSSIDDAAERIRIMMQQSELKTRLSELGIKTDADIDLIVQGGFTPGRMGNNPYAFTADTMKEMLQRIA